MTLKLSSEYKKILKNIFTDNELYVNYVISYNNGFTEFGKFIQIDELPTTIDELLLLSKNNNIKRIDKNILITINNSHKNATNYKYFKIEFIETII